MYKAVLISLLHQENPHLNRKDANIEISEAKPINGK